MAREEEGSSEKLVGGGQQAVEERGLGQAWSAWGMGAVRKLGLCPLLLNGPVIKFALGAGEGHADQDPMIRDPFAPSASKLRCRAFREFYLPSALAFPPLFQLPASIPHSSQYPPQGGHHLLLYVFSSE